MAIVNDIQLYCDADENGKITRMLSGATIRPTEQFRYFFLIDKKTEVNLDKFYIKDGKLEQIEGTTLINVVLENPTADQQLEDMKKQIAELRELLQPRTDTEEA
ncbi:hypothetical protein [Priestia aryabhattai]|uniref:Uncharacterized protein n=1 Tax=Priestia aryabhattai TaxID=412384 RepID=A0ABD7X4L8_PRIAR|nr:hypothetical protein [Priestia aryabhattai]WEA47293.1 hypothetical protein PWO00_28370 [Priestia aryabhattai]